MDLTITEMNIRELFGTLGLIVGMQNLGQVGGMGVQTFMLTFNEAAGAQASILLNGTPLGPKQIQVALVPASDASAAGPLALTSGQPAAAETGLNEFGLTASSSLPMAAAAGMLSLNPLAPGFNASLNAAAAAGAAAAAAAQPMIVNSGQKVENLGVIGGVSVAVVIPDAVTIPKGMSTDPKSEEIARTIYVGGLGTEVDEDTVMAFFKVCGEVNIVRMSTGVDETGAIKHAFVEFKEKTGAQAALVLNGQMLGTRIIKVGCAKNALVKPQKNHS